MLAHDARRAVTRAVSELPAGRREFVHALFANPEPCYADISRSLVMPIGSIGPTRKRVLRSLRAGLTDAGYSTSSVA